jgi:hypothetical protein
MVAPDDALSLVQTDSEARAARNRNFFRGLASSTVVIQTADVKIPAGNGQGRSDFFPSTFARKSGHDGDMFPSIKAAGFKGTLRHLLVILQDARAQSTTT